MQSKIQDPLKIRSSTAQVINNLSTLAINQQRIKHLSTLLKKRIKASRLLTEEQFGPGEITPQRIFLLDTVNHCFWAKKGQPKWQIEYPQKTITDGWSALVACFSRAIDKGIPILDASYLKSLSPSDARQIFKSSNKTTIPLLNQRLANLRQASQVLEKHFNGSINTLLRLASFDASKIANLVIKYFPSFQDSSILNSQPVYFYKRAQIFAYDVSLLNNITISNLEALTIFADYKLPQLLRHLKVFTYHHQLAAQIDNCKLIPKGSREEIEIRSATIWVGEKLSRILKIPPALVDNALWELSQKISTQMKPYHRTLTTCY